MLHILLLALSLGYLSRHANAQSPSTMRVPPLQWINLLKLTTDSPPPPLRDSVIGYDPGTRNLMIFGGQSGLDGFVSSTTYLLNLDTLTWSHSVPVLPTLNEVPPPRSRALGGADNAANERQSFLMFGGVDSNGQPLDDIWSYSYADRFWHQTKPSAGPAPAPRAGAVGGTDQTLSLRVPNPPNFQNTMYVFGGSPGAASTTPDPFSDAWTLTMDGALSANNLATTASWARVDWPSILPGSTGAGSTVLPNKQIVTYGGCKSANGGVYNASCAQQDSQIINVGAKTNTSGSHCPTPRFAPNVIPNYNSADSSFPAQVLLLFGSFDSSRWNDSSVLGKGEVAILDTSASTWSLILPSGDPGKGGSGPIEFPSSREGAAALSYPTGLVGDPSLRPLWSDTIVFGGQISENGNLTNELWLLRSYNDSLSSNGQHWKGWTNGNLQGTVNANGQGVTVTYLTQCPTAIELKTNTTASSSSTPSSSSPTTTATQPHADNSVTFETSTAHKVLSPVAVAILLAAFLVMRPVSMENQTHDNYTVFRLLHCAAILYLLSVGCSVAGLISAFLTTRTMQSTVQKRGEQALALRSTHGIVGLALSAVLYAMLLFFAVLGPHSNRFKRRYRQSNTEDTKDGASVAPSRPSTTMQSYADQTSRPSSPDVIRRRTKSASSGLGFASSFPWPKIRKVRSRVSVDGGDIPVPTSVVAPSTAGFEVINRPKNLRAATHTGGQSSTSSQPALPRSLSEINWLDRRRSLNTASELDYALSQYHNRHPSSSHLSGHLQSTTPGSTLPLVPPPRRLSYQSSPLFISPLTVLRRAAFQLLILANVIFTLVALWHLQSVAPFTIFLIWSVIVYIVMVILAWHGIPRSSVLALFVNTSRGRNEAMSHSGYGDKSNLMSPPTSPVDGVASGQPANENGSGPYLNNPPVRRTASPPFEYPPHTRLSPRLVESDPDDDEEDDEKQDRIEREMQRRDVSIITVPRRQLRIANM